MKIFRIPKKNGKFRTIYAPNADEKLVLQAMLPGIAQAARQADHHHVQHGFTARRSPVTNALAHRGYEYTLCLDLKDFFDSVTPALPILAFEADQYPYLFPDGAARQGLPTSPALANLAAAPMDNDIMALNKRSRFGPLFVYTRYADDLTFSFNFPHVGQMLLEKLPAIIERHGFKINPAKTHLQRAKAGRRHITGVAVDNALHPTRASKRRLRAARHQLSRRSRGSHWRAILLAQISGLEEWMRLRLPKGYRPASSSATPRLRVSPPGRAPSPANAPSFGAWQRQILK